MFFHSLYYYNFMVLFICQEDISRILKKTYISRLHHENCCHPINLLGIDLNLFFVCKKAKPIFPFVFKKCIEVQLIYNVSLLGVLQSGSVTCTYICFFRFFSLMGYYKTLRKVPCAIQQVIISYLYVSVSMVIPNS